MALSTEEKQRYKRQLLLPDFGEKAQEKLKKSSVFIAGAGGLGGPVALYMAAAGVGCITMADSDIVELSNLNRQVLHNTPRIGSSKAQSAESTLKDLNPDISIEVYDTYIDDNSIDKIAKGSNIIIDCLDNIPTRQVLNRYSIMKNIPIMHAGIDGWNAQITFIHAPETPCINCLFENFEEDNSPKPVLGALAGITACTQALEAIKYLAGKTPSLKNKLMFFDGLSMEWTTLDMQKNTHCSICSTL